MEHGIGVPGVDGAFRVASFVEKPDTARAEEMLSGGRHFWNSGMFIFGAAFFLAELERHAPEILEAAKAALVGRTADLDFMRLDAAAFGKSPSDSIDYAVMERTDRAATVSSPPAGRTWAPGRNSGRSRSAIKPAMPSAAMSWSRIPRTAWW
jgi:mannose-1-phosphate guanylyltransferase